MRKVQEVLRLLLVCGLSQRQASLPRSLHDLLVALARHPPAFLEAPHRAGIEAGLGRQLLLVNSRKVRRCGSSTF
ncbi:MAG: hypothetical protein WAM82_21830 [Thermoanaerobaculia bacterium]